MTLKSRIDRLERDHRPEQQWPCPRCGWSGQVRYVREEPGEDGVLRLVDDRTGAEVPGHPPCACQQNRLMYIEIRTIADGPEATTATNTEEPP
jgi:hypothetical protein